MKEDIWNMEGSCADRHDIRKAVLFIGNGRIIFLQIRGIRRKCAQMSGKNGKKKFFLLLAGILLVLNGISAGVYAMELGGFDVTTGVDDVDDWRDAALAGSRAARIDGPVPPIDVSHVRLPACP